MNHDDLDPLGEQKIQVGSGRAFSLPNSGKNSFCQNVTGQEKIPC
jgi:hypothetical protein